MRNYSYSGRWQSLLKPEIVALLTQLHEFKGEQVMFAQTKPNVLDTLTEIAKIQSTEASNRIEGIYTSDERLKKLMLDKTTPKSRNEQEIAGYRDVLATIHENYEYIPLKPNMILQLHGDLYKFSGKSIGGNYKNSDNIIAEEDEKGNKRARFIPVPAWETPIAMDELCAAYSQAVDRDNIEPLLVIPMFILDFLCIHPFNDGNGRMSRLLTLLLLYRAGYTVGKYISIEKLIEQSKQTYYDALQASSAGWHEGKNDYAPFVGYMLGVVVAAYRELRSRLNEVTKENLSKPDRVRELIKNTYGKITKTEIMQKCPDISQITVQRALNDLLKSNQILKIGGGRYTSYVWNRDKE